MAEVFREALETKIPKRAWIQPDVIPNLLLTTLVIVATAPFHSVDLGQPFRAKAVPQAFIPPNTLLIGIPAPIVQAPFRQVDWPITVRRDAAGSMQLDLVSYQAAVASAPFFQTEWPNPLRVRPTPIAESIAGFTTRGIPRPPPVLAIDWQNPPARKPQRFDDPPNLLTATLQAIAAKPFFAIDLGQPFKARIAPLIEAVPNSLILGIPQIMGFNTYDWPTPQRARAIRFDDVPNVAINAPIVATLPFRQTEQPNPPLRVRAIPSADIPPNSTATGIVPPPPFSQDEWVTPVRARPAQSEIAPNLLTLNLVAAIVRPFSQSDWPNPARARSAPQAESVGNTPKPVPVVLPFRLTEWPQPYRFRQPLNVYGWTLQTNAQLLPPPPPPLSLRRDEFIAGRDHIRYTVGRDNVEFSVPREQMKFKPT